MQSENISKNSKWDIITQWQCCMFPITLFRGDKTWGYIHLDKRPLLIKSLLDDQKCFQKWQAIYLNFFGQPVGIHLNLTPTPIYMALSFNEQSKSSMIITMHECNQQNLKQKERSKIDPFPIEKYMDELVKIQKKKKTIFENQCFEITKTCKEDQQNPIVSRQARKNQFTEAQLKKNKQKHWIKLIRIKNSNLVVFEENFDEVEQNDV